MTNYSGYYATYYTVAKCDICGAQGKAYSSKRPLEQDPTPAAEAAAAWNMRTGGIE